MHSMKYWNSTKVQLEAVVIVVVVVYGDVAVVVPLADLCQVWVSQAMFDCRAT